MMREILFRAKTTENEWVQGDLIHEPLLEDAPCRISYQYQSGLFVVTHTEEVLPETVGQYTGLKDKSGTKIFEGDIVKYGETVHKVVFEQRNGTAYYGLIYSAIETLPFGHYQDLKQIEVIGNIHDNPELLKEDSK